MMELEYKFVGPEAEPATRQAATLELSRNRIKHSSPMDQELTKTPEQIKIVELARELLTRELDQLGVKYPPDIIQPERVHFFSPDVYKKVTGLNGDGSTQASSQRVTIKIGEMSNIRLLDAVLHEGLHEAAATKYGLTTESKGGAIEKVWTARTGYFIGNEKDNHEHFRSFNEAVTEKIAREILRKNQAQVMEQLGIDVGQFGELNHYWDLLPVLDQVIESISQSTEESEDDVWARIKSGYFSGNMAHLRRVDKALGKGSLRFFAALPTGLKVMPMREVPSVALGYISASPDNRQKMALKNLNERERLKFKGFSRIDNSVESGIVSLTMAERLAPIEAGRIPQDLWEGFPRAGTH